jgi:hypothetical protein
MAIKTPMIAMTTRSSTNVNPRPDRKPRGEIADCIGEKSYMETIVMIQGGKGERCASNIVQQIET